MKCDDELFSELKFDDHIGLNVNWKKLLFGTLEFYPKLKGTMVHREGSPLFDRRQRGLVQDVLSGGFGDSQLGRLPIRIDLKTHEHFSGNVSPFG